jgi:MFS family permease
MISTTRWRTSRLVIVATVVMAVATLMQYSLSAISPVLINEMGLSSPEYGSLFTVYFVVCCLGSLAVGGWTQRLGAPWGQALVGITAAAGLLFVAMSASLVLVYVGLVLAGIASSFANPATNLALMDVEDRGPLIGIKQSGVQVSAVVSGAVVAPVASAFGWRTALLLCAAASVLLVPAALSSRRAGEPAETTGTDGRDARAVGSTSVFGLALFAFLMGCGLASTIAYLPVYATDQAGMTAGAAGQLIGVFGVCAVVGRVGWGFLCERSSLFARPDTSLAALSLGALVATVLFIAVVAGSQSLLYIGAGVMGLTGAAWNGLVMTLVVTTSDPRRAGRTSGQVQAAFFGGLCLSPLIFGLVIDKTGTYVLAWSWTALVYLMAFVVSRTRVVAPGRKLTPGNLAQGSVPGA